ncbi:hypothetical protein FGIG_06141 [Fasciola gigantica]|uniref:Uncharacterized protein n=1 Tax=Fasciola gigantica TaxID=46835 RepID=A0A504YA59_FASGI|nr:hypothetical protein FGIG_06141 [Fasciola gigantica]
MITYFTFALCFRIVDALFHFLLVWYYCTLTIRERILIANGSRIKGWWNIYHFISTACAGIMLIWLTTLLWEAGNVDFETGSVQTQTLKAYKKPRSVLAVSIIYFIISMGNIITVCRVIRQKMFLPPPNVVRFQLSRKYSFARPQIAQVELAATYRRHQEERDNHQENHMEAAHTEAVIPEDAAVFTSEEGKKKS